MRLQPSHVVAVEHDPPARRRQRPADQIEERRLAGAVRPDDAGNRSCGDGNVDVVDGTQPAKGFAEPFGLEQHHFERAGSTTEPTDVRHNPASPAGRNRISSTSARPKITIWYCCNTASTCESP